ncbi:hypothetical protein BKA70DRAFT_1226891 [Coprinopsis sp. MPI-PUGE-AT-0042]|nr:hypothetical protein BKA70DRAFT_1226891 [Coprinopsis sp. MPI-PUGE-AT-0042]
MFDEVASCVAGVVGLKLNVVVNRGPAKGVDGGRPLSRPPHRPPGVENGTLQQLHLSRLAAVVVRPRGGDEGKERQMEKVDRRSQAGDGDSISRGDERVERLNGEPGEWIMRREKCSTIWGVVVGGRRGGTGGGDDRKGAALIASWLEGLARVSRHSSVDIPLPLHGAGSSSDPPTASSPSVCRSLRSWNQILWSPQPADAQSVPPHYRYGQSPPVQEPTVE